MNGIHQLPTHYGNAKVAPMGPNNGNIGISPITTKVSFYNNTSKVITIVQRSGLKVSLPSLYNLQCDKLIVRVETIVHHSARNDLQKTLSAVDENSSSELKALKEALNNQILNVRHAGAVLHIDFTLSVDDLQALGGSMYFHEIDHVVSIKPYEAVPLHPYSKAGVENTRLKEVSRSSGFNYSIDIVDNLNVVGTRFFKVGSTIHKIIPVKDSVREDGVYIIGSKAISNGLEDTSNVIERMTIEEAGEKIGLFRTYEDAFNSSSDIANKQKERIAELENGVILNKLTVQTAKHEQELAVIDRNELSQEFQRKTSLHELELAHAQAKLDNELKNNRERVKDYYEERSYVRKDQSELVKALPSIIVGVGAIFLAISSFNKK